MSDSEGSRGRLADALRALADDEANQGASPWVEASLRQAVRTLAQSRRRQRATFLAVAAALLIVTAASWGLVVRHAPSVSSGGDRVTIREVATEFLPLTYGHLPLTDAYVVRIEVPRSALVAFGLASADMPAASDEMVDADVIVGVDGLARAVRFVHQVKSEE
jgi:hypothetical protein